MACCGGDAVLRCLNYRPAVLYADPGGADHGPCARGWPVAAMRRHLGWSGYCPSVQGEVVGTGVAPGSHLGPLHEQVVQQAGGAEAEPAGIQPVLPRRAR